MSSRRVDQLPIGKISMGLQPDTLPFRPSNSCLQLPAWRNDPDRPDEQSEDKLNLLLCKFLDLQARSEFPMVRFDHEEYQAVNRSVDLSAISTSPLTIGAKTYTKYDPMLVIECKRLPAPSHEREREYVTGGGKKKSGGIQRFKLGLHGAKLDLVAMIGYIQERCASDWHSVINDWIADLACGNQKDLCEWLDYELLTPLDEDQSAGIARSQSTHTRNGNGTTKHIIIHHLWIAMKNQQTGS